MPLNITCDDYLVLIFEFKRKLWGCVIKDCLRFFLPIYVLQIPILNLKE